MQNQNISKTITLWWKVKDDTNLIAMRDRLSALNPSSQMKSII